MLCYVILYYVILRCIKSWHAMLCYVIMYYDMLCDVSLFDSLVQFICIYSVVCVLFLWMSVVVDSYDVIVCFVLGH